MNLQLVDDIAARDINDLDAIYALLSQQHSGIATLVDGSKTIASTKNTHPDHRILCMKHPLRLIASTVYNRREQLRLRSDDFAEIKAMIARDSDTYIDLIAHEADGITKKYKGFEAAFDNLYAF